MGGVRQEVGACPGTARGQTALAYHLAANRLNFGRVTIEMLGRDNSPKCKTTTPTPEREMTTLQVGLII